MTKWNVTLTMFAHVIQTHHKKPYTNVVKNTLLYGTWNNAVVNQYKETS